MDYCYAGKQDLVPNRHNSTRIIIALVLIPHLTVNRIYYIISQLPIFQHGFSRSASPRMLVVVTRVGQEKVNTQQIQIDINTDSHDSMLVIPLCRGYQKLQVPTVVPPRPGTSICRSCNYLSRRRNRTGTSRVSVRHSPTRTPRPAPRIITYYHDNKINIHLSLRI